MSPRRVTETSVDDTVLAARARALSSPLRLRILRVCLHEPRTNKEIADALGINPGTTLHHVRTLVDTGLLAAQPERIGTRGAREVPYLATGLSFRTPVPGIAPLLVETFLSEIDGLPADDLRAIRLGVKVDAARRAELLARVEALFAEYALVDSDPDGDAWSLFFAAHPDRPAPAGS